jgi:nitrogen fixation/metabolism regulation signal transduction histidine kinase
MALTGDAEGGGLLVRALVPVAESGFTADPRILQLTLMVPASIVSSAESVEAAHRDYQELQLGRAGLKRIYTLTLTLSLLLALFAAIALAFFLAERLARPLLILAEGTQAVAAGDFTPRATVEASDELGVLTHSFNSMTHQLSEARAQADHHRAGNRGGAGLPGIGAGQPVGRRAGLRPALSPARRQPRRAGHPRR